MFGRLNQRTLLFVGGGDGAVPVDRGALRWDAYVDSPSSPVPHPSQLPLTYIEGMGERLRTVHAPTDADNEIHVDYSIYVPKEQRA